MSAHNTQPDVSTRHRSSSVNRGPLYNSSGSRPRSLGYYGANTTPYSSLYTKTSNPYSSASKYNSYSSDYQSPYFANSSTGSSSSMGFASLKIPAKSLLNIKVTPNYGNTYDNNREYIKNDVNHKSRRDGTRANRNRSVTRSRNSSADSGMGSRSVSLTSLNLDGYTSETERNNRSRKNRPTNIRTENGEIDYKMLYEQQLAENDKLNKKLRESVQELLETKQALEKINVATSKNSLSELEKRKRRSMERRFSEMEEELKQLQKLKTENERLKADNRSLTRVINKLTSSK